MISYKRGGLHFLVSLFQTEGSVFGRAFLIAMACSFLALVLKWLSDEGHFDIGEPNSTTWNGFNGLMGFLIVFRTSQAYSRFWEGCSATAKMRSQWLTACSSAVVFSKCSKVDYRMVLQFQHTLVRLCSLMHMVALAEIEDTNHDAPTNIEAFKYEVLDLSSFDMASMKNLGQSDSKVELVFQWTQQLIADNVQSGVLSMPPPIVSRVFQELGNGMVQFHEALKLSSTPFPFPYAQICNCLLVMHWVLTPLVMSQWTPNLFWAVTLSFLQVFTLWSLNAIAVEIENPFGTDPNDIDAHAMQLEFNRHVTLLVDPERTQLPKLVMDADADGTGSDCPLNMTDKVMTFYDAFEGQDEKDALITRSGRANDRKRSRAIARSSAFRTIGKEVKLVQAGTESLRRRTSRALHATRAAPRPPDSEGVPSAPATGSAQPASLVPVADAGRPTSSRGSPMGQLPAAGGPGRPTTSLDSRVGQLPAAGGPSGGDLGWDAAGGSGSAKDTDPTGSAKDMDPKRNKIGPRV